TSSAELLERPEQPALYLGGGDPLRGRVRLDLAVNGPLELGGGQPLGVPLERGRARPTSLLPPRETRQRVGHRRARSPTETRTSVTAAPMMSRPELASDFRHEPLRGAC